MSQINMPQKITLKGDMRNIFGNARKANNTNWTC